MTFFDPAVFAGATWAQLGAHLEALLADARARNDGALDAQATAALRGRIGLLKELLALPEAAPARAEGAPGFYPT